MTPLDSGPLPIHPAIDDSTEAEHEVVYQISALDLTAVFLLLAGAFDLGATAVLGYDLVGSLFGYASLLTRTLQSLVGLSALYAICTFSVLLRSR